MFNKVDSIVFRPMVAKKIFMAGRPAHLMVARGREREREREIPGSQYPLQGQAFPIA
jgi:hypothetical protein